MTEFDESKHPRDEDGKFTSIDGSIEYRLNTSYGEILGFERDKKSFETKQQARDYFEQISKNWEKALSDFEKKSIKGYTDQTYDKINTYLRNPRDVYIYRNFNRQEIEKQINGIDTAISKFELPNDIVVYRGTNIIEFGKDLNDIDDVKKLMGKEIVLSGYSSTSTDKGVSDRDFDGEVLIEYSIPKG